MTSLPEMLVDLPLLSAALVKMTLLLACAWLAYGLLRARNPRWRVLLWRVVLMAIVVLPLAEWALPHIDIAISQETLAPPAHAPSVPEPSVIPINAPARPDATATVPAINEAALPPPSFNAGAWLRTHELQVLIAVWSLVALVLLLRSARGWTHLRKLVSNASPAPDPIRKLAEAIAADLDLRVKVDIRVTDIIGSPFLAGIRRPVIVLPTRCATEMDTTRLRAILAHELAHATSRDPFWLACARLTTAMLWFHPLLWRVNAAHASACEEVCDGVAAAYLGSAEGYAQALAREALALRDARPIPGVPMLRDAEIIRRLRKIQQGIRADALARRVVASTLLLGISLLATLGCLRFVQTPAKVLPIDQALTQMEWLAAQIEANNAKLERWQGRFEFREYHEFRGAAADRWLRTIAPTESRSANAETLRRDTEGTIRFAVDCPGNALFTDFVSSRPTAYVWKETGEATGMEPQALLQRSVVTSNNYLHYTPADSINTLAAFRDPPDDARDQAWSTVVDPRAFLFDTESQLRRLVEGIRDRQIISHEEANERLKFTQYDGAYSRYELSFITYAPNGKPDVIDTIVTVFDERKGFNPVSSSLVNPDGQVTWRMTWDYDYVDAIYVPSAHGMFSSGPNSTFQRDYTLLESEVNANIDQDTFTYKALGMREGERLVDNIEKSEYFYRSGELVKSEKSLPDAVSHAVSNVASGGSAEVPHAESAITTADESKSLVLENPGGPDYGLRDLDRLKSIEHLVLIEKDLPRSAIDRVGSLGTLRSLRLCTGRRLTRDDLVSLSRLTNLRELWLESPGMDPEAFAQLPRFTSVERLCLGGTGHGPQALGHLAEMVALKDLQILDLNDVQLAALPIMPQLQRLDLTGEGYEYTAAGFGNLSRQFQLKSLKVQGRFEDGAILALSPLPALTRLELSTTFQDSDRITDAALAHIATFSAIEDLVLYTGTFTDAGFRHLARLPNLKRLQIVNNTGFTNAILDTLAAMPAMEEFKCRGENITGDGLDGLVAARTLKRVEFWSNGGKIAGEALRKLSVARPDLTVVIDKPNQ